jgi:hypothetical protein
MITSVVLEFGDRRVQITVQPTETHRIIEARCEGLVLSRRDVREGEVDCAVQTLIEEITAKEFAATILRQTMRHKGDTFIIEVWGVERAFRSCVKLDGEIITGVVAWDDIGAITNPQEIADVHARDIRNGTTARSIPKDYFPG